MPHENTDRESIISLYKRIANKRKEIKDPEVLQLVTDYIAELKFVGVTEGLEIGGRPAKLLYVDGKSWCKACRILNALAVPNFVIWVEKDFFSHFDLLVSALVKAKTGQEPPDKSR